MNDYEGLNLPQLLELMHEIVMPDPISRMPDGPGWWVFFGWLTLVGYIIGRSLVRRYQRNRYRREAITMVEQVAASADASPANAAANIAVILKQTALVAYPRTDVAALYGDDWARFLNESASNDPLVNEASQALAHAAYDPDADGRKLVAAARRWIKVHRA